MPIRHKTVDPDPVSSHNISSIKGRGDKTKRKQSQEANEVDTMKST